LISCADGGTKYKNEADSAGKPWQPAYPPAVSPEELTPLRECPAGFDAEVRGRRYLESWASAGEFRGLHGTL
jgi:hypothetical protein